MLEEPEEVSLWQVRGAEAVARGGGRAGGGDGHCAAGGGVGGGEGFLAHLCAQREQHVVLRDGACDVDGAGGFGEGVFLDWGAGGEAGERGGGGEGEGLRAYANFWAVGPWRYGEEGGHDVCVCMCAVQCTSSL